MNTHILKEGERVAKKAIFHVLVIGIIKGIAGVVTGMTVLIADAIGSLSDILGLFASYIGLHLSRKSANKNFEYGYYKIETFAAFLVSLGIIFLGCIVFSKGVQTLVEPSEAHFRPFAITAAVIAIFHSLRLQRKLKKTAEKVNSLSLEANARDKKMNVIAGFGVLISIVANYGQVLYIEGIVTMVISVFILKVGVQSAKESLFFLLDYWNDPILVRRIRRVLNKEKEIIRGIKKLRLRRAGTFIFGEAYIEVNPFADIQDLREELDIIQRKIQEISPYIKDFPIYSYIPRSESMKVAVPISSGTTLNAHVATSLKDTRAYLFANIKKSKIKNFYIKKIKAKQKKPMEFVNFFKKEKVNILINNKIHSLSYYNLRRSHQILIYPNFADIKNVKQTLELLLIDT